MVWIEYLDTTILSESVGARLKRRKLHASAVPASSVHASDDPEPAGSPVRAEDSVILISPSRQGALADLGLCNCHDLECVLECWARALTQQSAGLSHGAFAERGKHIVLTKR